MTYKLKVIKPLRSVNSYDVIEYAEKEKGDNPSIFVKQELLFSGSLIECEAYIRLKEKGQI